MAATVVMAKLPGDGDEAGMFLTIAELGLVLLLFADASHCDLDLLRDIRQLPTWLLSVGMLLTIVLAFIVALVLFDHLSIWEAGILAAVLAPTDAGLGQAIVTDKRVPQRIREALNVEAGLNDELAVPFLLFFIALAVRVEGEVWQTTQSVIIGADIPAGDPGLRCRSAESWPVERLALPRSSCCSEPAAALLGPGGIGRPQSTQDDRRSLVNGFNPSPTLASPRARRSPSKGSGSFDPNVKLCHPPCSLACNGVFANH